MFNADAFNKTACSWSASSASRCLQHNQCHSLATHVDSEDNMNTEDAAMANPGFALEFASSVSLIRDDGRTVGVLCGELAIVHQSGTS